MYFLFRFYYRDRSWGADPVEKFHLKYRDITDLSEEAARAEFATYDPAKFNTVLGVEQLPLINAKAFDLDRAYEYVMGLVTPAEEKPKVKVPAVMPEVWNTEKVDTTKAMDAVRQLSRGAGFA